MLVLLSPCFLSQYAVNSVGLPASFDVTRAGFEFRLGHASLQPACFWGRKCMSWQGTSWSARLGLGCSVDTAAKESLCFPHL